LCRNKGVKGVVFLSDRQAPAKRSASAAS